MMIDKGSIRAVLFDFDNTLFETEQLKRLFYQIAELHGYAPAECREMYVEARDHDGKIIISLASYISVLHEHLQRDGKAFQSEAVSRVIEQINDESPGAKLVPGALALLRDVQDHDIDRYLLSLGVKSWQEKKVHQSGVEQIFPDDHIRYTDRLDIGKIEVIRDLFGRKTDGEGLVLFNDKPTETADLLQAFPKMVAFVRRERKDERFTDEHFSQLQEEYGDRIMIADSLITLHNTFHRAMSHDTPIGIVILAAGHGTRMKTDIPKVMNPLHGKPLVDHVVTNAEASRCCDTPVVVVCEDHTLVQDHLGSRARYAIQREQLGTGHAVKAAEDELKGTVDHVVVLYGDMPFLGADSIRRLVERHKERGNTGTLMTTSVPNFDGDFAPFYGFGRIVRRSEDGHIAKIVEKKDASEEEVEIKELNTSYFCFKADWLWEHLAKLGNDNAQGEYYLTDLVKMAIDEGEKISSIAVDPKEAIGVNTKEDLDLAHSV